MSFAQVWLAVSTLPADSSGTNSLLASYVRDEILSYVHGAKGLVHWHLSPLLSLGYDVGSSAPAAVQQQDGSDVTSTVLKELVDIVGGDRTELRQLHICARAGSLAFMVLRFRALETAFRNVAPGTQLLTLLSYDDVDTTVELLEGSSTATAEQVSITYPLLDTLRQNDSLGDTSFPILIATESGEAARSPMATQEQQQASMFLHAFYVFTTPLDEGKFYELIHTKLFNGAMLRFKKERETLLQRPTFRVFVAAKNGNEKIEAAKRIWAEPRTAVTQRVLDDLFDIDDNLLDPGAKSITAVAAAEILVALPAVCLRQTVDLESVTLASGSSDLDHWAWGMLQVHQRALPFHRSPPRSRGTFPLQGQSPVQRDSAAETILATEQSGGAAAKPLNTLVGKVRQRGSAPTHVAANSSLPLMVDSSEVRPDSRQEIPQRSSTATPLSYAAATGPVDRTMTASPNPAAPRFSSTTDGASAHLPPAVPSSFCMLAKVKQYPTPRVSPERTRTSLPSLGSEASAFEVSRDGSLARDSQSFQRAMAEAEADLMEEIRHRRTQQRHTESSFYQ